MSTIGLYGGGVVFNDVFDAELDKLERPERPIPKGIVTLSEASILGIALLILGILASFAVSRMSGGIAVVIAIASLVYDKWSKHSAIAGPLNMGLCRGLNLLLGVSIIHAALENWWFLAFVPVVYIAAITMISRGEVHGGDRKIIYTAGILYGLVILSIFFFSLKNEGVANYTIVLLAFFAWMIFTPLIAAIRNPEGSRIKKAVRAGVISLIIMNSAWALAFNAWPVAIAILLLLPLSLKLGKLFAVT